MHNATTNPEYRYIHQDMVDAIANLTTSAIINRVAMVQIMATIASLTTELATMNENLAVSLQTKCASCRRSGGH